MPERSGDQARQSNRVKRRLLNGNDPHGHFPASYCVDGPQPLAVSFRTPRLSGTERRGESDAARAWTRVLQLLPVQQAVPRIGGGEPSRNVRPAFSV